MLAVTLGYSDHIRILKVHFEILRATIRLCPYPFLHTFVVVLDNGPRVGYRWSLRARAHCFRGLLFMGIRSRPPGPLSKTTPKVSTLTPYIQSNTYALAY